MILFSYILACTGIRTYEFENIANTNEKKRIYDYNQFTCK